MNLKELFNKYKELISYGFWGVATTVVNYAVYFLCTQGLHVNYMLSNVISWIVAVVFAFLVNKVFVFGSSRWERETLFGELWKFVSARVLSGAMETLVLFVFVDLLHFNDGIIKIVVGILVILLNYVVSKLLIFKK